MHIIFQIITSFPLKVLYASLCSIFYGYVPDASIVPLCLQVE